MENIQKATIVIVEVSNREHVVVEFFETIEICDGVTQFSIEQ